MLLAKVVSGRGPERPGARHRRGPVPRGGIGVRVAVCSAMFVAGIGIAAYPALTDLRAGREQRRLKAEFATRRVAGAGRPAAAPAPAPPGGGDGGGPAAAPEGTPDQPPGAGLEASRTLGSPVIRIVIPTLGIDSVVVEGITPKVLQAGAGHYPQTPLPGERGNVAIAGHRTMFGRPFAELDRLKPGDRVILDTVRGRFTYRIVRTPWTVGAYDWSVIDPTAEDVVTLTTCHPPGDDTERLVARARLAPGEAT